MFFKDLHILCLAIAVTSCHCRDTQKFRLLNQQAATLISFKITTLETNDYLDCSKACHVIPDCDLAYFASSDSSCRLDAFLNLDSVSFEPHFPDPESNGMAKIGKA